MLFDDNNETTSFHKGTVDPGLINLMEYSSLKVISWEKEKVSKRIYRVSR